MKITDPTKQLDSFTLGYCEIMLADEDVKGKAIVDIAEESMDKIIADCAKFQSENAELLAKAQLIGDYADYGIETAKEAMGNDFYYTRHHHGVGYFDRNLDEVGDKLDEAAKLYGETWAYIGDDGKVYLA